jgi:hypothetical protein
VKPPPPNRSLGSPALAALLAVGVAGAFGAHRESRSAAPAAPIPAAPLVLARAPAPAFVGPPRPAPADLLTEYLQQTLGSLGAGPIGYMGPIAGPLNTSLSGGYVRGPIWNGEPLPQVGSPGLLIEAEAGALPAAEAGPEASSELPDAGKLALARLANPTEAAPASPAAHPGAGGPAAAPAPEVSPEKPLTLRMAFQRPVKGYEPGASVTVKLTAAADAYVLVLGVDGTGRAVTLGKSAGPVRSFGIAFRAQAEPGPQYLVALASVHPLTGPDVAAALRGNGPAWLSPVVTVAREAASPANAWAAAAGHAQLLGGAARGWQRHEWTLAAGSFAVRAPAPPAAEAAARPPRRPAPTGEAGLPPTPPAPQPGGTLVTPRREGGDE